MEVLIFIIISAAGFGAGWGLARWKGKYALNILSKKEILIGLRELELSRYKESIASQKAGLETIQKINEAQEKSIAEQKAVLEEMRQRVKAEETKVQQHYTAISQLLEYIEEQKTQLKNG